MKTGKRKKDFGGDLSERFRGFSLEHKLWKKGQRLLAAVSGGADSVALLGLLDGLRGEFKLDLTVVHLDHGLRGAASRADSRWVKRLAARLGFPIVVERRDVRGWAKENKKSLEEAARRLRYAFFQEVVQKTGIRTVAVGHQADDQAETVLMRIIRGSSPAGIGGMRPKSRMGALRVVRPLLPFTHSELAAYLEEIGWGHREDASNRDRRFLRNRLRLELLPLLEKEYNPRIREVLINLGRLERERNDCLSERLEETASEAIFSIEDGLEIDLVRFARLPAFDRGELLRKAMLMGGVGDLNRRTWERLEKLVKGRTGGRIDLPGGVVAAKAYGRLSLTGFRKRREERFFSYPLPLPGEAVVKEAGLKISARKLPRPRRPVTAPKMNLKEFWTNSGPTGAVKEYFDCDRLKLPLSIRSRRPGDRYRPLKLPGGKKIKDILIDEKVPRPLRGMVPLVIAREKIIWLAGYRPAHDCRVTDKTRSVLELTLTPIG